MLTQHPLCIFDLGRPRPRNAEDPRIAFQSPAEVRAREDAKMSQLQVMEARRTSRESCPGCPGSLTWSRANRSTVMCCREELHKGFKFSNMSHSESRKGCRCCAGNSNRKRIPKPAPWGIYFLCVFLKWGASLVHVMVFTI